jgi:hypothetical protein
MASSQTFQPCSSSTIAKVMQRRGRVNAGCDNGVGWRDQASCTGYPTKTKPPVALLRKSAIAA